MARSKLSDDMVEAKLSSLEGWQRRGDRIVAAYRFENFVEAFGWMTSVALVAERMDHHPEWRNVYGTVDVELSTHDAGGLTDRDFALASEMNRLAALHRRA